MERMHSKLNGVMLWGSEKFNYSVELFLSGARHTHIQRETGRQGDRETEERERKGQSDSFQS